jgi:hypothetical protein
MLKVYTDQNYLTTENRRIVFPLLFDLWYRNNAVLKKKYELVKSMEEAEVVIIPVDVFYFFKYKKKQWLYDFIDKANKLNKKVWVYTAGDFGISLNKKVHMFRFGGFNSKMDKNTFVLPAYTVDPYQVNNFNFKTLVKSELPCIAFVGHANGSILKLAKEFLIYLKINFERITKKRFSDYQPFYPSGSKRYKFLRSLQKNNQIQTDFIFRKRYRAGAKTEEERKKTTAVFFENIYNNPYTLCLRGAGNFSVRLYETLAMGRIPVVIDTDIRLPLNTLINWEKHCLIVSETDVEEKLIAFHDTINHKDFEQMQEDNRTLWLNYLNREAYFNRIYFLFND